ncbi:MAG: hypothetical protein H6853_08995 [Rhodospirillales bacterium]|nr:hypothetical protein [Alphaproteobacteria bacterium]USO03639.1 MAG: hypothetical protein H6853_08995 [Rhodospirillales bacterium]
MAGGITADIAQDTAAQSSYQSYMSEATRAKLGHTATLLSKWAGMDVIFIGPDDVDEGRNAPEESFVNNVMKQHPSYGDVGVNGKSLFEIQTQHINTGGPHSVAITPGLIDVLEKEDNIPIERNAPLSREVCIVYNPWLDLSAEEIAAEKTHINGQPLYNVPGTSQEWNTIFNAHEIAGHCKNRDTEKTSDSDTYKVQNLRESNADLEGIEQAREAGVSETTIDAFKDMNLLATVLPTSHLDHATGLDTMTPHAHPEHAEETLTLKENFDKAVYKKFLGEDISRKYAEEIDKKTPLEIRDDMADAAKGYPYAMAKLVIEVGESPEVKEAPWYDASRMPKIMEHFSKAAEAHLKPPAAEAEKLQKETLAIEMDEVREDFVDEMETPATKMPTASLPPSLGR